MAKAIIGIGSNLGDRENFINFAFARIGNLPNTKMISHSAIYETAALGGIEQGTYLNAVALVETDLLPAELLKELQNIENIAGRVRDVRWGPRTLDLDILDFENFESETEELQIPHPRAAERKFVLQPLSEIACDWNLSGQSISQLLMRLEDQQVSLWIGEE